VHNERVQDEGMGGMGVQEAHHLFHFAPLFPPLLQLARPSPPLTPPFPVCCLILLPRSLIKGLGPRTHSTHGHSINIGKKDPHALHRAIVRAILFALPIQKSFLPPCLFVPLGARR
jgi:hypothetical protein